MRRTVLPLLALLLTLGPAACVTYTQVELDSPGPLSPTPGDEVRVRLAPEEGERLARRTGRRVDTLDGRIQAGAPVADSLRMMVTWGPAWAGTPLEGRREEVSLPRSGILTIERKEVSRSRTAVLGVALAATAVVLFRSIGKEGDGQSGGLPPDAPPPPVDL
ncbi:MAG: hypothetical protein EA422_04665 [Gemmatimonadales bacterium]|nr:MAG: hypothetical protein EA422_04665 [Gemmatimonadales bacterium]